MSRDGVVLFLRRMPQLKVLCVVGARPNFMKMAPIVRALGARTGRFATTLVHTGQHYDAAMSKVFFDELGMPRPDVDLNVGSGSHASQTAAIMAAFEPVLLSTAPELLIVVGDVNSTIACALVGAKLGVRVAHVEAGLRSFDRTMPEEINRVLTDQISDLLFTTEASAEENLRREGVAADRIHFVGNVMIDTLLAHRDRARAAGSPRRYGLNGTFGLITLHRPANVDNDSAFESLFSAIEVIARDLPFVFPVHPRTRPAIVQSPTAGRMIEQGRLTLLDPLGYLEFVGLMEASALVLTDSGGIQEETTILGVPCLTLRNNTERPITVTNGTNVIAGTVPDGILAAWQSLRNRPPAVGTPPLWDGRAAERIADVLETFIG
jgi:UDP-N-acetylglucosamine 2-epimerase (non-hydrolysing)